MAEPESPKPAWGVLAVVSLATFMAALDGSVVNVALPVIRSEMSAELASMEWVPMAYLLSICALLLPFGRLGDMTGFRILMGLGFAGFGLASVACGLSRGLWFLVGARTVQGIGAALLMASGPALLSLSFHPSMRGRVLGLQATATYAGLAIGPTLGGLVTDHLGWRWVFWINLPAAAIGTYALLREKRTAAVHAHRMDLSGGVLFAAALVAGIVALEQLGRRGSSAAALAGACGILLVLFIVRQRKAPDPLLPLWLFRSAPFSAGVAAAFLQYIVIFVPSFLVPFFLEGPMRLSADHAGLIMSAQPVVMVSITGVAGWASDKIGVRWPAAAGMAVLAFALWRLGGTDPNAGVMDVVVSLAVLGLGVGLFTSPNNSAILGSAPRDRQGVASALLAAARNVGMVVGVSVAGAVFAHFRSRTGTPDEALLAAFKWGMRLSAALAVAGAVLALLRPSLRKQQQRDAARAPAPRD